MSRQRRREGETEWRDGVKEVLKRATRAMLVVSGKLEGHVGVREHSFE